MSRERSSGRQRPGLLPFGPAWVSSTISGSGSHVVQALVDEVPKPIKEAISKDEADEIEGKIKEAGGSVEIK